MQAVKSLEPPSLDRTDLEEYFRNTWELYEWLFGGVTGENALYERPDPLRNPLIFYLGHTAAFYVNKLVVAGLLAEGVDPRLDDLFARGVDPADVDGLEVGHRWPTEEQARRYRAECFERVMEVVQRVPAGEKIDEDHPYWALHMGLEHDRIHFETSSVLMRQASLNLLSRPDGWEYAPQGGAAPDQRFIEIGDRPVRLGKPGMSNTFGWDNEYGSRVANVAGFEVTQNLVTNGEYLDFVLDEGYRDPRHWSPEGWVWRSTEAIASPKFWRSVDGEWLYRATFDEMPLPASWPVEVNWFEAEAYCRWAGEGARLLSELEFGAITSSFCPSGERIGEMDGCNLNLRYGSPCPVGMLDSAISSDGVTDVVGNVWVWLGDTFKPLSGFRTHPYYDDFSAPYFDDDHMMMLGGSWASSGTSASRYYRLWFRKHFYQHAGFRMARHLG